MDVVNYNSDRFYAIEPIIRSYLEKIGKTIYIGFHDENIFILPISGL